MTKLKQIKAVLKENEFTHRCEVCATKVKTVGKTTQHYEAVISEQTISELVALLEDAREMAGHISVGDHLDTCSYRLITGCKCDCYIEKSKQYLDKLNKFEGGV